MRNVSREATGNGTMTSKTATKQIATRIFDLLEIAAGMPVRGEFLRKRLGLSFEQYDAAADYLTEQKLAGRIRGVGASLYAA